MREGDPMELNFEGLEMQKVIICLVIMFIRVMIIKTSKMAHFSYFLLMTAKSHNLGKI